MPVLRGWTVVSTAAGMASVLVLTGCPSDQPADSGAMYTDVRHRRDGFEDVQNSIDVPMPVDAGMPADTLDVTADAADALASDIVDVIADPMTHVRFGNLMTPSPSPAIPVPAIDLCIRPAGGSMPFTGPLFALPVAGAEWNQVTQYYDFAPGRYDIRIVAGNATNCDTPLLPTQGNLDFGAAGSFHSVIFFGHPADMDASAEGLRSEVLADRDPRTAATARAPALRVFAALPGASRFDVGLVGDPTMPAASLTVIFEDIGFGEVGRAAPAVMSLFDWMNYFSGTAIADATVGARLRPGGPVVLVCHVEVRDRSYTTSFLTQIAQEFPRPPAVGSLFCADWAPPMNGLTLCLARIGSTACK